MTRRVFDTYKCFLPNYKKLRFITENRTRYFTNRIRRILSQDKINRSTEKYRRQRAIIKDIYYACTYNTRTYIIYRWVYAKEPKLVFEYVLPINDNVTCYCLALSGEVF